VAKKEKEKPATLNFDGEDYLIDELSDTQRELAAQVLNYQNHVADLQNKLRTNVFVNEQLIASERVFIEKMEDAKTQLRAMLNPEDEEKAAA
jgi:hypothetical protein